MESSNKLMERFGPGIWWGIHQSGKTGDRDAIERDLETLPCLECKEHSLSYLISHPFPKDPGLLFVWTVDFHNWVNLSLGYPTISVLEAEKIYSSVCKTCAVPTQTTPVNYIQPLVLESRSGPKSILKATTTEISKAQSRNGR